MNAKFRMPKLWGNNKYSGTFKELVLTTIATTVSIILTFGTTAWLNQREEEQARRLFAMTVINDIEQSLDVVKNRWLMEEEGREATNYLLANIDRLESISNDTIYKFFNYVSSFLFNTNMEFKMTNENIFNSSQDSWSTLNDRKFLNNVQDFYSARTMLERVTKEWVFFQKPLTKEEEYQLVMENGELATRESFVGACRRLLQSPRVINYLHLSNRRTDLYKNFLRFSDLNEENMFLMNITKQDMEAFLEHTDMTVNRVTEEEMVGMWDAILADNQQAISYEFRKNHTFTTHQTFKWTHGIFQGVVLQKVTLSGTWAIEGDSLVKYFDLASYKVEVDDSNITYSPAMADSLVSVIAELKSEKRRPDFMKLLEQNNRVAHATNLDKSGTRLELRDDEDTPMHFLRKE